MKETKLLLKNLCSGESFFIESSEDFEKYTIKMLRESNYSVSQIANFFGVNQRAMYYRMNKLGCSLGKVEQFNH